MKPFRKTTALLSGIALFFLGASAFQPTPDRSKKGKWVSLFNGTDLNGWHSYNHTNAVGWMIENGLLTSDGTGDDLTTDREYGDFDLRFEFKIPAGSNSGVFYKVLEKPDIRRTVFSAPEYQIIDDVGYMIRGPKGEQIPLNDVQKTGANYDLHPPLDKTAFKPAGTWNKGRIVVEGPHVRHYLNGKLMADYQYGSEEWHKLVQGSKYKDWVYASPRHAGKIALQSHNPKEKMWFRNIKIKEL